MEERKRKPAPPEPPSDPRLRNLLPQLESLVRAVHLSLPAEDIAALDAASA